MKTISVSDEQYEFFKEMKKLLTSQDNRCTRDPMFCIESEKEIPAFEGCGDYSKWIDDNGEVVADDDEEFFEYLMDNYEKHIFAHYSDGSPFDEEKVKNYFLGDIEFSDNADLLDTDNKFRRYEFNKEAFIDSKAFSFFEEDMKEHLQENKHHYPIAATTYATCNWRVNRMNRLRELLINIELD